MWGEAKGVFEDTLAALSRKLEEARTSLGSAPADRKILRALEGVGHDLEFVQTGKAAAVHDAQPDRAHVVRGEERVECLGHAQRAAQP